MIELFKRKLVDWKKNFPSKGGIYTLIKKSILANLPIYYPSTITIPVKVAKRLEAIQCRFLLGDNDVERKYHLVKWDDIKEPIIWGGGSWD